MSYIYTYVVICCVSVCSFYPIIRYFPLLCDMLSVWQWPVTGRWFSLGTSISATNKTDATTINVFNILDICVSMIPTITKSLPARICYFTLLCYLLTMEILNSRYDGQKRWLQKSSSSMPLCCLQRIFVYVLLKIDLIHIIGKLTYFHIKKNKIYNVMHNEIGQIKL